VIAPYLDELVLFKTWYSAFADTRLQEYLIGVTDIILGGVATDCCIQQSVFDADRRGFRSIVPLQAVSASSCESFTASLVAIAKSAGDILDLADVFDDAKRAETRLDIQDIEQIARIWFQKQQTILGNTSDVTLEEVLRRLDQASTV
jgi:isochorismate hydrolase